MRKGIKAAFALGGIKGFQAFRATRFGLDRLEFDAQFARKALGVIVPGGLRPVGHTLADGDHLQLHALRAGAFLAAVFAVGLAVVFLAAVFLAVGFCLAEAPAFLAGALVV